MIEIKRLPKWRSLLMAEIEATRELPVTDRYHCGFFVADCVRVMTGADIAELFRHHTSLIGAFTDMRRRGFADMSDYLASVLPEVHPSKVRMGDVVTILSDLTGQAGGVVIGQAIAVRRPEGMGTLTLEHVHRAFKVP